MRNHRHFTPFLTFLVLIPLFLFTGCAQLQRIETQNKSIQQQLDTLGHAVDDLNLTQGGATRQMKADLAFLLRDLKEQLDRLHAELDESQYRLKELEKSISILGTLKTPPAISKKDSSQNTGSQTSPQNMSGTSVEKLYHQAREDYITGKYDLALKGFQTVYEKDPSDNFKDNALYWIGEAYYKKKEYKKAFEYYSRCIQEFPKGNKTCAALFKIGLLFEEKGEIEKRNQSWKQLQKPTCKDSNEALQATELMKENTSNE